MLEINFVGMMEGSLFRIDVDNPSMDKYWYSDQWILEPIEKGRKYQCLVKEGNVSFLSRQGTCSLDIRTNIVLIENIKKTVPNNSLVDIIVKESMDDFIVYDVIYWNSEEFLQNTLFDRRKKLESIQETCNAKISKIFIKDKYNSYLSLKSSYSAFYFKNLDSEYVGGHLSGQWKILKEPLSFFLVIMDVIEGQGKYQSMCSALKVGQFKDGKLTSITNIGGMTYDDRIIFFKNKEQFIGKVVEIKASEKTANNYIEARFFRLRDDKTQEECVF